MADVGARDEWRRLRPILRPRGLARFVRSIVDAFLTLDLLTAASAIAFQTLFALIPLALAGLALLGFLDLEQVWEEELVPVVREQTSDAGFEVVDRTVSQILGERRGLWLTLGMALMVWYVSGAVRAVMGTLNRVYDVDEERSFAHRMAVSFALSGVVAACVGLATAALHFGEVVVQALGGGAVVAVAGFVVRWLLAILPLVVLVGVVVRYAPSHRERSAWFGVGAAFVVVAWIGTSLVFGWYVTSLASYSSLFGGVATVIVLMTYIYVSSIAFLVGVQVDAMVRRQATGHEPVVG